ncbi:MAG: beta-lactamase family protein [Thermoguttaceae bacterium]|nr:beta-lactamase family protein [Thermoguttaceae bacterium]
MKKFIALGVFALSLLTAPLFAATPMAEALAPYVESGDFPGFVVATATADEVLAIDAVGWADRENQRPMTEDTMFWMASMTKAVVGCCAAILIDEGKLDIDAPITDYIPEFADLQVYRHEKNEADEPITKLRVKITSVEQLNTPLTVRHCLTHTGGWRFLSPLQKTPADMWDLTPTPLGFPPVNICCCDSQKALITYAMMGLDFQPGERYSYSNVGINVAQAVIERIAGMPIDRFMQQRIFDPLGMTDTTFWPNEEQIARMAACYAYNPQTDQRIKLPYIPIVGYPYNDRSTRFAEGGGGLFSTVGDFMKFYQMLAGRGAYKGTRIISEEACDMMTSKQTPDNIEHAYGFGLEVNDKGFGHGGAAGTDASVTEGGLVTVYAVQLQNFPHQWEPAGKFREAAAKYLAEKNAK